MLNLNQKGLIQIAALIILVVGLIAGVYLVGQRTNILPFAHESLACPVNNLCCQQPLKRCSSNGLDTEGKCNEPFRWCYDGYCVHELYNPVQGGETTRPPDSCPVENKNQTDSRKKLTHATSTPPTASSDPYRCWPDWVKVDENFEWYKHKIPAHFVWLGATRLHPSLRPRNAKGMYVVTLVLTDWRNGVVIGSGDPAIPEAPPWEFYRNKVKVGEFSALHQAAKEQQDATDSIVQQAKAAELARCNPEG